MIEMKIRFSAADRFGQEGSDHRSGERAERTADADEPEESLGLVEAPDVGHESAEDGHDKQIEDAEPDEERIGRSRASGFPERT